MKKVDELQVGERFRLGDREFKIQEIEKDELCNDCFFYEMGILCEDFQMVSILPQCSYKSRKDKKDVIFKEALND